MPNNSREEKTKEQKDQEKRLHLEVAKQMVTLSTAGFGLVSALAWNNLIQEFVNTYVKRWLPVDGKFISLLVYAVVVTVLAVVVTLQLSKIVRRIEDKD
jgi:Na+/melibiose symporter-like transporter